MLASLPFLRRLQRIPERAMREARLREQLMALPLEESLGLLSDIITLCLIGQPPGEDSMLALIACLRHLPADDEGFDLTRSLYEASETNSVERFLLLEPPPHRTVPSSKPMGGPRWERDVSLGEKKSLARGSRRLFLERLLLEPEPQIVEKLCANPRIREEDILTIVTRRPTYVSLLETVAQSRWLSRYRVRHALVLNPYGSTATTLRLLPLLHEPHLKALQFVGDVHPLVHDACVSLLARREGLLEGETPGEA